METMVVNCFLPKDKIQYATTIWLVAGLLLSRCSLASSELRYRRLVHKHRRDARALYQAYIRAYGSVVTVFLFLQTFRSLKARCR